VIARQIIEEISANCVADDIHYEWILSFVKPTGLQLHRVEVVILI